MRTLIEIDQALKGIELRVNQLDGTNLKPEDQSEIAKLRSEISGLKKTLGNVNMGYISDMKKLTKIVTDLQTVVTTHMGGTPSA